MNRFKASYTSHRHLCTKSKLQKLE